MMELIVDIVLLILSVVMLVVSISNAKKYDKLKEKQTMDSKHIETLYNRLDLFTHLEGRIIDLEKQSKELQSTHNNYENLIIPRFIQTAGEVDNVKSDIEKLYGRTNVLQECISMLSNLEQRKQSEIRANYNMDFTHINTDI